MFWRNPDAGKLFTHRYVRKQQAVNKKVIQKFIEGTEFALKTQKKMTMMRARQFVRTKVNEVTDDYNAELKKLLERHDQVMNLLEQRERELNEVTMVNYRMEMDLFVATRQKDYLEPNLAPKQISPRVKTSDISLN